MAHPGLLQRLSCLTVIAGPHWSISCVPANINTSQQPCSGWAE
jgi:hypothetical protein